MVKKSIATRWFTNSFVVVMILLVIIDICLFFVIQSFYYTSVEQYLTTEANIIAGVLNRIDEGDTDQVREAVESFEKKNQMELMAIDQEGRVDLSSSGFSPEESYDMPDYNDAMQSRDGVAQYVGYMNRNTDSEKYMAVTVAVNQNSAYNAIRMVTSLEAVDKQIITVALWIGVASIAVLLLVLMLGLYFIKSILMPINQVVSSARRLAQGDFSTRIVNEKDDEVGELCRVFNYMADELENSETIKNEFISSVSHELRTPLTAIKGWSETILEMHDEQTTVKGMRVITAETERLSVMVEELLDFSRIQNNSLLLQKTNMDVLAELADALLVYAERAKRDGITINYNEPDAVAMIFGDKNRIRQVFINIIDNAIKYSGANGVVNVEAELTAAEIHIKIQDNGCGISEADLPKVKTRFYKANNTVRGSGIGLAVADQIVAMHEGTLELASVQGEGTTVTIVLPILQKKAEETPAETE